MKRVIILKGLPGSGKSTWAKKKLKEEPNQWKRVNKDDIRAMLDNGMWNSSNEKYVLKVRNNLITQALEAGYGVIVDDTNLHTKHEHSINELVRDLATVEVKQFKVPVATCVKRDAQRANPVGSKVIYKMYRQFIKPSHERIAHDPSLDNCIICDIDGTVALHNGRNPYDASTCEEDLLNTPIARIVHNEKKHGTSLIFVTGRDGRYEEQTNKWLKTHFGHYHYRLYMRKAYDSRSDSIIKEEIYTQNIKGKYNVLYALDDRDRVVDFWRNDIGLTCLQVAEGDF